jgi:hypothetical protein
MWKLPRTLIDGRWRTRASPMSIFLLFGLKYRKQPRFLSLLLCTFDVPQSSVISAHKLYTWDLGLITATFSLILGQISLKILSFSFVWLSHSFITQSEAERQHLLFQLVLDFEINTLSVTSGPILLSWLCRGPGTLCSLGDLLYHVDSNLSNSITLRRLLCFVSSMQSVVLQAFVIFSFPMDSASQLVRQLTKPHWAQFQYL